MRVILLSDIERVGSRGTVVNVKEDEIVLKVDESTNTKVTFVRGAIQKDGVARSSLAIFTALLHLRIPMRRAKSPASHKFDKTQVVTEPIVPPD